MHGRERRWSCGDATRAGKGPRVQRRCGAALALCGPRRWGTQDSRRGRSCLRAGGGPRRRAAGLRAGGHPPHAGAGGSIGSCGRQGLQSSGQRSAAGRACSATSCSGGATIGSFLFSASWQADRAPRR
ncbi:hypothetical protein PVAP13_8KG143402 [Panicum virgatum]|uniref:Uncharacterized protein n=1 Tax=Panicum virgatum TaxID=38727 RepID=A0A8T0PS28_PANVG|nr:hypothetical protein PVAP13_8KG143402 [Panicum virgatum]